MKALPDGERRVTLRASDVPLALMTKLHLVVARIDGSLRLLTSRAIRTSRFSMAVGPAVSGDLWRLEGLGMHPIEIKRVSPTSPVPVPPRPLLSKAMPRFSAG